MSSQYVYMLETLDCDWDEIPLVKGVFSDLDKAIGYVKQNYFLIKDTLNEASYDGFLDNIVFSADGYNIHPSNVKEDEKDYYVLLPSTEGYLEREYLNTTTSFTITRVRVDSLLD